MKKLSKSQLRKIIISELFGRGKKLDLTGITVANILERGYADASREFKRFKHYTESFLGEKAKNKMLFNDAQEFMDYAEEFMDYAEKSREYDRFKHYTESFLGEEAKNKMFLGDEQEFMDYVEEFTEFLDMLKKHLEKEVSQSDINSLVKFRADVAEPGEPEKYEPYERRVPSLPAS